ncbi:MAG TPA: lysophospholipid acyltransferase family protein [Chthoniobacterales bacterium]
MNIEGWRARWLIGFGYRLTQLWVRTLRFELEDRGNIVRAGMEQPFIFAVWHNRLLLLPSVFRRFLTPRHAAALISASGDGDLIAALVERFGYGTVRGSSSRKGASALLRLAEVFASGTHLVITPDGPRGPVYQLGQGVIFLAQKCDTPVVPANLEYSSCWRFRSWDRFILPRPFSKVRVIFGVPLHIAATENPEEFEKERLRLQNAIMDLVERK